MAHIARTLVLLRQDRRGVSFLELVSSAALLSGIMMVAGTTFERELHILIGSVRAAVIGLMR